MLPMSLRIAIDVDETVAPTLEAFLGIFNKEHGTSYRSDEFTSFDVYKCMKKEHADILYEMFESSDVWGEVWLKTVPYPKSKKAIQEMLSRGNEVFFVSNCYHSTHSGKSKWLQDNFGVGYKNHIYTAHKDLLLVDYLIDDNTDWIKNSIATRVLITRPWNCNDVTGFDCRVNDVYDAWLKINELERGNDY